MSKTNTTDSSSSAPNKAARTFLPAKPSSSLSWIAGKFSKFDLDRRNRVYVNKDELANLSKIPHGYGVILTPNHADEMDPRVCFEISRQAKRRFIFMCNREAFDEAKGAAGWALQRIGAFSVERGGKDADAKQFAQDVVKKGKDTLVIFPEGEVFYLNEAVQPFHSGAIEIGIQAIIDQRKAHPNWTAYLVPMSIKYKYPESLHDILDERVQKLEEHLAKGAAEGSLQVRLKGVAETLVAEKERKHKVSTDGKDFEHLEARIKNLRHSIISEVGGKHKDSYREQARTLDKAFQLSAALRQRLSMTVNLDHQIEYAEDLQKMKEVEHLVSLQPEYVDEKPSPERLAELVIKLEREIFGIQRPKQLAKREVYVRIGKPIDLAQWLEQYNEKPHAVRHDVAEQLRSQIQSLLTEEI